MIFIRSIIVAAGLGVLNLAIGCKDKTLSDENSQSSNLVVDTIKPEIDYTFKTNCINQFEGYFCRFGYWISNYYTICDHQGLEGDSIAVLSPKILTPEASSCRNENEVLVTNRLLVVNVKRKKEVYSDIIENEIGAGTCGGEFIEINTNGFILYKETGQACKFLYKIEINYLIDDFYVSIINLDYHCPSSYETPLKFDVRYQDREMKLSKYNRNIIDSLRIVLNI